jgi:hypothetical protein
VVVGISVEDVCEASVELVDVDVVLALSLVVRLSLVVDEGVEEMAEEMAEEMVEELV